MHTNRLMARVPQASEFAVTHCMRCQAGWTRSLENDRKAIFCLLDREPVPATMTNCDRYELRED